MTRISKPIDLIAVLIALNALLLLPPSASLHTFLKKYQDVRLEYYLRIGESLDYKISYDFEGIIKDSTEERALVANFTDSNNRVIQRFDCVNGENIVKFTAPSTGKFLVQLRNISRQKLYVHFLKFVADSRSEPDYNKEQEEMQSNIDQLTKSYDAMFKKLALTLKRTKEDILNSISGLSENPKVKRAINVIMFLTITELIVIPINAMIFYDQMKKLLRSKRLI